MEVLKLENGFNEEAKNLLNINSNYIIAFNDADNFYAAYKGNYLIGIGSLWKNKMHPYRQYISIVVDETERNKGYGTKIFEYLKHKTKLQKFQTAFDSCNVGALSFAKHCGFYLARKCYCYEVTKTELKSLDVMSLKDEIYVVDDLIDNEKLFSMIKQDYECKHINVNPMAKDISKEYFINTIKSGMLLSDSYVLVKNQEIEAYFIAYKSDDKVVAMGYTGTRVSKEKYRSFLYDIICRLFSKYDVLELEIDGCDEDAMFLGKLFSKKPIDSWDAYLRD
ncbi:GNAT family N-acetyltransferase [Sedimentibacter sp. zth1]|uniref:GNAT family N-acetyltransferase n=1 Tax=Sedimentibacter sp. zth1 TaxID=2816908 RepID=UPI001A9308AF|nr:GNAT family N-acetyltransferase [Sedimentibacter sp. zth1]QSX06469.1 GNAT family N-acetyltransferase [Sedimentibacter sp. zth1]